MNFFSLRMKRGKGGDDNPVVLRQYIHDHGKIGIGALDETRGSGTFESMQIGDIVIVLSQSRPLVMVLIKSPSTAYKATSQSPEFNWLAHERDVKILSWYDDDREKYQLPQFRENSWIPATCGEINSNYDNICKWYEAIMKNNKRDGLKNLLIKNYNLILTGAPGTGKTFLAREIAIAIAKDESRIGFCQFHPSFDYTDFVEGLRPTAPDDKGNIGFQRQDGIFKSFCAKAIRESSVNGQDNFDESWNKLVESLNDENSVEIKNISGRGSFRVELNEYGTGLAKRTYETEEAQKRGEWISGQSRFFSKDQLYNIYRGLPGIPSGGHDNYRKAIIAYLKNNCGLREYKQGTRTENSDKRFVFIIDEINRGDISKIFGELFYSIDPGYRGDEGRRIQTQYANMLKNTGDIFELGFYVPENVYIIGTMNDIDRSVESMDFAIRRRFTWIEIKASEENAVPMFDKKIPNYKDEALKRMKRLNDAISSDTSGLGEAFHIGPAYFLKLANYQEEAFERLWEFHLAPLLQEYLRGMPKAKDILTDFHNAYTGNVQQN